MQASREWAPPGGKLGEILADVRAALPSIEGELRGTRASPTSGGAPRPFAQALRGQRVAVIAEVKRRSPSKGVLAASLDAIAQAQTFELGGAAAISVLTEPRHFGGSGSDLVDVVSRVRVPALRKDFHIEPEQLDLAARQGASAVLLIARALAPDHLPRMMAHVRELGLEALVEVRSESELERALEAGAEVVGVNSRDLETLEVDARVPERIMPRIPAGVVAVWESGIETPDDVRRAADHGADAVLVGSALSVASDATALVRSLAAVPRGGRRG